MGKKVTTLNLTRATHDYVCKEANRLSITISVYSESLFMSRAFKNGYKPTKAELENLRKSFLVRGNMTGAFREQIATFSMSGQASIIEFIYDLNLIEGCYFSTQKMANLFKNDELCYFALGRMGRQNKLINDYIKPYCSKLKMVTLGENNAPDNEYLFFSRYQQFKVQKPYLLFTRLLQHIGAPLNTDILRVHFTQLVVVSDAISKI